MRAKPFVKPSVVDERVNDPVLQIDVDLTYGTTMNDPVNERSPPVPQRFVGQHRIERKNVLSELLSGIFSPQPRIPSMFEWSLRIIV